MVVLLAALTALAPGRGAPAPYVRLLKRAQQALVVTTPGWNSVDGILRRFEKISGVWKQAGDGIPVVVGKNGIAWDPLLKGLAHDSDPIKKEGDGRSPAGVFAVTGEFGFELSTAARGVKYLTLTDQTECVDDVNSGYYNQVVNRNVIPHPDWNSSERMRAVPGYKWGALVGYNPAATRGAGSCIFLHIWSGPGHGTAGCTAMGENSLRPLLENLDAGKHPVLIQLTAETFESLRKPWSLP